MLNNYILISLDRKKFHTPVAGRTRLFMQTLPDCREFLIFLAMYADDVVDQKVFSNFEYKGNDHVQKVGQGQSPSPVIGC